MHPPDTRATYSTRNRRRLILGAAGIALLAAAATVLIVAALSVTDVRDEPARAEVSASTMDYAVFLGDEYTQGGDASSPTTRWVTMLAEAEGWEPSNLGKAGTGYVVTSGTADCGRDYCPNVEEMVPAAVEGSPDVVVVATGHHDLSMFATDRSDVVAAIRSTYTELRTRLPDARIIAVGPLSTTEVTPEMLQFDATVEEVASEVDATFVSLMDPDVIQPGALDGVALTDAGHAAIAERIAAAIAPARA